jgi:hypothetical protein
MQDGEKVFTISPSHNFTICFVAGATRTPNLVLASDISEIIDFLNNWEESPRVCVDIDLYITNK